MAGISERVQTGEASCGAGSIPAESSAFDSLAALPASLDRLMRTIEGEIIPRLVLAHRGQQPEQRGDTRIAPLPPDEIDRFTALLLEGDTLAPGLHVTALRERGVPLESIYLELFAPVARRLGEMWSADLCDFTTVTLALWRLQRLLHEYAPMFQADAEMPVEGKRILLAPLPGEQHTFGLFMVAEFFRRAGWDVIDGPVCASADLVQTVSRQWFAIIGLSLSCEHRLDELAAVVRDVRRASRNRGVGIMVGGPVFIEHADAVLRVDADVSAVDARQALQVAQDLLFASAQRRRAASAG